MSPTESREDEVQLLDIRNYGKPPAATRQNPFAQVVWIFERAQVARRNPETRGKYVTALNFYLDHLRTLGFKKPFVLAEEWDQFALIRFRQELELRQETGTFQLASYTRLGLFSAVRVVMKLACSYDLLKCDSLVDVTYESAVSETDWHAAYSAGELAQLLDAVGGELQYSRRVLAGYVRQPPELGRDPRISPQRGRKAGYGYAVEENMRWYFEHVLGCKPLLWPSREGHEAFLKAATDIHGGVHELYRRWNVAAMFDLDILMPHVVQLAYLTGLNPSSLLLLDEDCYGEEHPATGRPYLRYRKERANRENELHLSVLDEGVVPPQVEDSPLFEEEVRFLLRKQATQIGRTIATIKAATGPLRERLPSEHEYKNRLLIYESLAPKAHGEVLALSPAQTSRWCREMVDRYRLQSDSGEAMSFNLVRFRSTKLTEMALQGRDLLEIQLTAAHADLRTTVGYLSRKKLDAPQRAVVTNALSQIHANRDEFQGQKNGTTSSQKAVHVYQGLLSDCKNVYDPPAKIRQAASYREGQPCNRFNMCLFCKNVLVFRKHLPVPVTYLNQIKAISDKDVQNLPHGSLYKDTRTVIEELLNPETGEFSEEDIRWANDEAVTTDALIDPVVYRGVD